MSVAIRAITRLADADDVNVTPGVGVDEYALVYDHDTAKFVLRAPTDLSGYALLAGRAGGQTLYGGTAANEDITIHGTSNATRTTSYVLLQPTAGNVGIGTTAPGELLHVYSTSSPMLKIEDATANIKIGLVSGYPGIWLNQATPSVTNYAFLGTSTYTLFNTPAGGNVYFGVGNSYMMKVHSAGGVSIGEANSYAGTSNAGPGARSLAVEYNIGAGVAIPLSRLHAVSTTATTNALRNVLTLGANVTGAGAGDVNLGPAILFQAESTTTVDTTQAAIEASWIVATHATRTSRLALKAYDTAEREGIRIDASGTAALLGFYGHAAAAQPSAYTPSNVSADRSFDADTVLVAELADVVGTLIADLQSIGLLA